MNYCFKILFPLLIVLSASVAIAAELKLWLGQVEYAQLRDGVNNAGESELIIEWLCKRYVPKNKINLDELNNSDKPIKVKSIGNEYFVNTFRTQDMPRSTALELVEDANNNKPTMIRHAYGVFVGELNNKSATYIGGGSGGIYTNKLIIE